MTGEMSERRSERQHDQAGPARAVEPVPEPHGLTVREVPQELDPEWDEVFNWSYGPRLWNIGCG
jgi:hypothetical protein